MHRCSMCGADQPQVQKELDSRDDRIKELEKKISSAREIVEENPETGSLFGPIFN